MNKRTFKVYFQKGQICKEYYCEYQQLKIQVAKDYNGIPFDCLLLIDQNNQVYSATQLIIQKQFEQYQSFYVYDVREIFQENLERQKQQQYNENQEIQSLKVKLYDYDQQIQKQEKKISQFQIEFQNQKAELEQEIIRLNIKIKYMNDEKQKNEYNFLNLIDEKMIQIKKAETEQELTEKEIEKYKTKIQQFQTEIEYLQSNKQQDINKVEEKNRKTIQQLQEELSQLEIKLRKKDQEITDMQMGFKAQKEEDMVLTGFSLIAFKNHEQIMYENIQLKSKVEFLTQKLNNLQSSNSQITQAK
ncbi:unnamed protein product [Paramecium primaurelia]|uniref:Uncharacterized protein n=1 Tax=Paramecium primaurelia TaxID=5886 RepID=A0A8S1MKH8_PARPR|nr:unnamed protein product [Paramecium primaurelia]